MANSEVLLKTEREGQVRPLSRGKRLVFQLISVILALFILAGTGEILLRLLPLGRYRSAPFRQYDPVIGLSLIPNMKVVHSRGCFTGLVETNRWGFRDRDRTLEKPPGTFRIALIGDSAVEAVHVQPEEVMNIQMEKLLQQQGYRNMEVMNFAVEGIGTTQELLLYKERVRQFHPDLVMILFSDNDIFNNSSTLQPKIYGIHTWYAPYYDLDANGNLVFRPVEPRPFDRLSTSLERHSYLFYYLERAWFKVDPAMYKWRGLPLAYEVYEDDPINPEWKQAWMVTEKVMAMTRETVEADGAKFLLLVQPDAYAIDPQWREHMVKNEGKVPADFKPSKFYDRLQEMTAKAGVTVLSTIPYLQAYSTEHQLQPPYFSLPCDPHYSAMGHAVTASAIVDGLQKAHFIPPPPSVSP
jgi:lysophospholipase L1-like esterase